jgi:parvulin-like peptidyl-prolyl isomerase
VPVAVLATPIRVLLASPRPEDDALSMAVHGGLLGRVPRGQLYPQLHAVAFTLAEGMLSEVIDSELGYHLVRCEAIQHERQLSFAEARQTIREHLEAQQQALCQKVWVKTLRRAGARP